MGVCVKVVGLINPGLQWNKLTMRMTAAEGSYESTLQVGIKFTAMVLFGSDQGVKIHETCFPYY